MVRALGAASVTLLLAMSTGVMAQQQHAPGCIPHNVISDSLAQKYDEHPRSVAVQNNNHIIEIFATDDGSTWTAVITRPDGCSAVVAAGSSWEVLPVVEGAPT